MPSLLSVLACAEDLPPVRGKSELLVLRAPTEFEICGGTFAMMEAEVLAIRDGFGSRAPTVDYSWMPESHYDADAFPCETDGAWACTQFSKRTEVYARSLAETHELVHAARHLTLPSVLEEGLATLYEHPARSDDQTIVSREELLAALESGTWQGASSGHGLYQRSAHFISFLFAGYGKERFVELERRIGSEEATPENHYWGLSGWRAEFEAVYGPFDAVWSEYENYPDCSAAQFKAPLAACAMLETAAPSATLDLADAPESTFMPSFACGDEDAIGPYVFTDRSVARAAMYVIEIVDAYSTMETIELTGEIAEGTRALLTECGDCTDRVGVLLTSAQPSVQLNLPQNGTYVLILYQDIDEPGAVGITVR